MFTEQKPPCAAQFGVPNCAPTNRQRLHLVAAVKKGAAGIGRPDSARRRQQGQRFVPLDLDSRRRRRYRPALQRLGRFPAEYCFMIPAGLLARALSVYR
jgi:hypothetical protein